MMWAQIFQVTHEPQIKTGRILAALFGIFRISRAALKAAGNGASITDERGDERPGPAQCQARWVRSSNTSEYCSKRSTPGFRHQKTQKTVRMPMPEDQADILT